MSSRIGLLFAVAAVGVTACRKPPISPPDLILYHGKIFTADTATAWTEALAIAGDRIVAIGPDSVIRKLAGPATEQVDLGARAVVPGFNDAHDHIGVPESGVHFAVSPDPIADPTFAEIRDSIRAIAQRVPAGTWITTNIAERILSDSGARRAALDRLAPHHPVRLQAWTGHGVIYNSAAMAVIGWTDSMPDRLGGRLERDAANRLTGLAEEYAQFVPDMRGPPPSDSAATAAFVDHSREAARLGITTIQNMTTGFAPEQIARILPSLNLPVRLRLIRFPGTTANHRSTAGWEAIPNRRGRVSVSGTKWILDGTPIERLAVLRAPYSDRPGWYGRLDFPPDTLKAILQEAVRRSDQPLIHAVGDSAIGLILSTMTAVAPDSVWQRLRLRIEHGEGLSPDQYAAAHRLGVIVCQNPTHLALGPMTEARYGAERLPILQPVKSLLANGIALCFGSDGPINPFLNVMFATMHPNHPAEAISVEEAVRAYTSGSAYAEGEERDKGTLTAGMLADVAVLSADIFTIPRNELPGISSVLTLVGGKPVWDPNGMIRR